MKSLLVLACGVLGVSCAGVVRYTDQLGDARYGRSWFTRLPAVAGGATGFTVGLPIDVLALPVTGMVYASQPPAERDPTSVFLYPSIVLYKAGTLLGAPFDAIEWAVWRRWQPPRSLTPEELDAIERHWDQQAWPEYPVRAIYPAQSAPASNG